MKKSFKFGLASLAILPLLTPIQEGVMAASSQSAKFKIPTILNSSNKAKRAEFEKLFKQYGIKNLCFTTDDLIEIDSTPINVVVHKASVVNGGKGGVIVEDTSLDVDGKDIGINIRWLLNTLKDQKSNEPAPTAICRVCLAFKLNNKVFVSTGIVKGKIVPARGTGGFGFDPYFLPDGATKTLGEAKPDSLNARAKAIENLMHYQFSDIRAPITQWEGKFQHT